MRIDYLEDGPDGVGDASGQFVQIFQGELSKHNFASTIDRRSVELTFKGFMQNFAGAPIVPIDVNFQTMISKSLNVITSPDTVTNTNNPKINGVHSAFLSKQSIIEQLLSSATLKGNVTISGILNHCLIKSILRGLEKPGKTKGGLANAMGVRPGAVSELFSGIRLVKASEIPLIVEYLELDAVPIMGRIGAGAVIEPEHDQVPPEGLGEIHLPFPIAEETIAFEVSGDSVCRNTKTATSSWSTASSATRYPASMARRPRCG